VTEPLLDAATMADLTLLNESAMQEAVTITIVTPVDDGGGSSTDTETTTTTTGLFWTVSGDEAGEEQVKARGKHRIEVPKTLTVAPTSWVDVLGKSYDVKFVFPVTYYSTALQIGLEDSGRAVAVVVGGGSFLLELGDYLLLETGEQFLLEAA
jgi:hypothetical protein